MYLIIIIILAVGIPSQAGSNPSAAAAVRFGRAFAFEVQSSDFGVVNMVIAGQAGGLVTNTSLYGILMYIQIFPANTAYFKNTVP